MTKITQSEKDIKIADVISTLKTTNLVSEFGNNCDFLKQLLILFYNLNAKGIAVSKEERQDIFSLLNKIENTVKETIKLEV